MYSTHRGAYSTALFKPLDSRVEITYAEQYVVQVSGHTGDFMLFGGPQPRRGQSHGGQREKAPTSEIHRHGCAPHEQNLAAPNTKVRVRAIVLPRSPASQKILEKKFALTPPHESRFVLRPAAQPQQTPWQYDGRRLSQSPLHAASGFLERAVRLRALRIRRPLRADSWPPAQSCQTLSRAAPSHRGSQCHHACMGQWPQAPAARRSAPQTA